MSQKMNKTKQPKTPKPSQKPTMGLDSNKTSTRICPKVTGYNPFMGVVLFN